MMARPTSFSIRESDRCLETSEPEPLLASYQDFQYPRVGSLPRNGFDASGGRLSARLSVSASRIVASKRGQARVARNFNQTFSIRESDRCLETDGGHQRGDQRLRFQYPRVGSLPRNSGTDRCCQRVVRPFQYPRVGSLPRNSSSWLCSRVNAFSLSVSASRIVASKLVAPPDSAKNQTPFSIRESDRCLETRGSARLGQKPDAFQYPRVGSLPRNGRRQSCGIGAEKLFQYPRVGSLPRNR